MSTSPSTQVQLVRRPQGWPEPHDFAQTQVELPELADGEVRVANAFISVDPYMRGKMNDVRSYTPPYPLGETMTGAAVGRVVATTSEQLPEGTVVLHQQGWRDVAQGPAGEFRAVPEVPGVPLSAYLGILGATSLTAWVGLRTIAGLRDGDVVFVSGAAGAVGSAAGQLARLLGASTVIGSAGSPAKVATLTERYGFDAAFDYHDGPADDLLADALRRVGREEIDLYFDNVGGEQLEAAIGALAPYGRAALCGAISAYNATEAPPGPRNLGRIVTMKLTLRGFIVSDHLDQYAECQRAVADWLQAGELQWDETVVDGIEHAVQAFLDLLHGGNVGKMVVRTGP